MRTRRRIVRRSAALLLALLLAFGLLPLGAAAYAEAEEPVEILFADDDPDDAVLIVPPDETQDPVLLEIPDDDPDEAVLIALEPDETPVPDAQGQQDAQQPDAQQPDAQQKRGGLLMLTKGAKLEISLSCLDEDDKPSATVGKAEVQDKSGASVSEAEKDQELTLVVDPADGYELNKVELVYGDKQEALTVSNNKASFKMPGEAVTLKISFKPKERYAIRLEIVTLNAENTNIGTMGGTVTELPSSAYEGQIVKLRAKAANSNYEFVSTKVGSADPSKEEYIKFTMPKRAVDVTVTFRLKQATVTFDTSVDGNTKISQTQVDLGKSLSKPANPTAYGYHFVDWYTDKACKKLYDFSKPVTADLTLYAKWQKIEYTVTKNAQGEWAKQSGKNHEITVKRNIDDQHCVDHFSWVSVDGVVLTERRDYTVEAGSAVLKLKPAYLNELSQGKHDVHIQFDDGVAYAELKVHPPRKGVPTGDANDMPFWTGLMMFSFAACTLGTVTLIGSRERRRGRG